jgi:hypothetical protein
MKPTGMSRIWQTLRDLDQALVAFCGPWNGSPRVTFGSTKGWVLIAVLVVSFLGCIVLNRIQGRGIISGEALLSFGWFAVFIYYSLRTPAKDQARSNVPQER